MRNLRICGRGGFEVFFFPRPRVSPRHFSLFLSRLSLSLSLLSTSLLFLFFFARMPPLPPKPQQQQRQLQQAAAAKKRALLNATKQKKKEKETPAAKPKPPPSTSTSTSASSSSTSAPKILLFPAPLATRLQGAHKPLGLVLGSSLLLQASVDLYQSTGTTFSSSSPSAAAAASAAATALSASSSSSAASSALLPLPGTAALTGAALGLLYACVLLPLASRTAWASPEEPLSVVVTGGSRGLGKAMAREHLLAGDSVVVASRDWQGLVKSARELSEETGADLRLVGGGGGGDEDEEEKVEEKEASSSSSSSSFSPPPLPSHRSRPPTITPIACDVSNPASVTSLVAASLRAFEGKGKKIKIDCFYNNAGESGTFRNFADSDPRTLSRVVSTNMLGAVLCTRAVMDAMKEEGEEAGGGGGGGGGGSSGHIFFVEVRSSIFSVFRSFLKKLSSLTSLLFLTSSLFPGRRLRRPRHARVCRVRRHQGRDGSAGEIARRRGSSDGIELEEEQEAFFFSSFAVAVAVVAVVESFFFVLFFFLSFSSPRLPRPQPGSRPHLPAPRRRLRRSRRANGSSFPRIQDEGLGLRLAVRAPGDRRRFFSAARALSRRRRGPFLSCSLPDPATRRAPPSLGPLSSREAL